jgi:hypothetical protein
MDNTETGFRSVAVEEFGHLGRGRRLAGELGYALSLEDQAQRALMLIGRLGLEIRLAVGADDYRGHLTSAMIEIGQFGLVENDD